jgi:uncharacterized membrane protein (DUF373 family)
MSNRNYHDELPEGHEDPLLRWLHKVIRFSVKILAVLMTMVILWGVADVIYMMAIRVLEPPRLLLTVTDIFQMFGAFMVVLIAIEIFVNIRLYLGTDVLPVKLVIATALMAMARKIIVLDFANTAAEYVYGISLAVAALGLTYWLLSREKEPAVNTQTQVLPASQDNTQ